MPKPNSAIFQAMLAQKAGRLEEAEKIYSSLLEDNPDQPQALLLLGLMRAADDRLDEAEKLFSHYLALMPEEPMVLYNLGMLEERRGHDEAAMALFRRSLAQKPDFPPTYNAMGVSLHRLGYYEEAVAAFDRAMALNPDYAVANCNRGVALAAMGKSAAAMTAFQDVLAVAATSVEAWHNLGIAYYNTDAFAQAETAFRNVLALDPDHMDALLQLAQTLENLDRPEEAQLEYIKWAKLQKVAVTRSFSGTPKARLLFIGGTGRCNVPTNYIFDRDIFETASIYLLPEDIGMDKTALQEKLPAFDIIFNAVGDADAGAAYLPEVEALCARLDRPVLNPPERIAPTRRDLIANRMADIPQLLVPSTRRLSRAELAGLAGSSAVSNQSLLIRPCGAHGGDNLACIDHEQALADYLRAMPYQDYYLTSYYPFQSADGYFRKYRFIFVDGEIFPYHLAISEHWLVHYVRTAMQDVTWMREEEEAFLADYTTVFQGGAGDAVREVARRLGLDYGGLDCALLSDGRVVFFEANASMLVHLTVSRENFGYKYNYVPRIVSAVSDMVIRRLDEAR